MFFVCTLRFKNIFLHIDYYKDNCVKIESTIAALLVTVLSAFSVLQKSTDSLNTSFRGWEKPYNKAGRLSSEYEQLYCLHQESKSAKSRHNSIIWMQEDDFFFFFNHWAKVLLDVISHPSPSVLEKSTSLVVVLKSLDCGSVFDTFTMRG